MRFGELIQMIRDLGGFDPQEVTDARIKAAANAGLRHICSIMRYPQFCIRGPLYPKRTVYVVDSVGQLGFEISTIDRAIVYNNSQQDKALRVVNMAFLRTSYAGYDVATETPATEYATEYEAVDPLSMEFCGWEVRAPTGTHPNGAVLLWVRPPSNQKVTNGLWIYGVQAFSLLKDDDQVIPVLEVHQDTAMYWAIYIITKAPADLVTYREALSDAASKYKPGRGDIPVPVTIEW